MVYKRVIERGGKKYTYYYENYRDENGRVRNRILGSRNPDKKNNSKKIFVISFLFLFAILIVYTTTNFDLDRTLSSYKESFSNKFSSLISGYVVSSGEEVVEKRIEKEEASLEIKKPSNFENKNKIMDFDVGGKGIRLSFDKLNYSNFFEGVKDEVEADSLEDFSLSSKSSNLDNNGVGVSKEKIKEKVEELGQNKIEEIEESSLAEVKDFDIEVVENSTEDYKWGYKFRLEDFDFLAKVEVSSEEEISIYNSNTLRIGNSLLSFSDLEAEGYKISFEKPVLEIEKDFFEENVNESFNEEETVNESVIEENNFDEAVNDSLVSDSNFTEESLNETNVFLGEENESLGLVNETLNGTIAEENSSLENSNEEIFNSSENDSSGFSITGSVVRGMVGLVGNVVKENSFEYENKISVYIERDFRNSSYSIGEIVFLDPTLVIIPITDAVHLDSNKEFVSNIYNGTREQDGVWSGVIGNGEYVRATFEEALNNEKDITIYARSVDNFSVEVEVYEENSDVLIDKFTNIKNQEELMKIFLTNLSEDVNYTQSTFDLKIVGKGAGVEFDWIVDPYSILVQISTDASVSPFGNIGSKNLVRLDNDRLVATWIDASDQIKCAYSDNDGTSWSIITGASGTYEYPSIATNGTRVLIVADQTVDGDIVYVSAENGCPSSGFSLTDITGLTSTQGIPSLEFDGSTNRWVMCYQEAASDVGFAYLDTNSSSYTTGWTTKEIKNIATFVSCGISVDPSDGEIHICVDDDEGTDFIWYMSSSDLFATTNYDKSLSSNTLSGCDISARDGNVVVVSEEIGTDLFTWYSDDGGANFVETEHNTDQFEYPTVCLDNIGTAHLLFEDLTGPDFIEYANYTLADGLSVQESVISTGVLWSYNSMLCHGYPENNRMTGGLLEFLAFQDSADDIYFANFTIAYTPLNEPPTAHTSVNLTSQSGTNTTNEYLNIFYSGSTDADSDPIYNVTDWRIDGDSFALINYPFDLESSSSTNTYSTYTSSGSVTGATWNGADSISGGSYYFDGTGDEIVIDNSNLNWDPSAGPFTISLWLNSPNNDSNNDDFFSQRDGTGTGRSIMIIEGTTQYLRTFLDGVGESTTTPIYGGSGWRHIVFNYNGSHYLWYVDGFLVDDTNTASPNSASGDIVLGAQKSGLNRYIGHMDQVLLFNRTLDPLQILALYLDGSNGKTMDVIASQETRVGENWTAVVTPNDLKDDGTSVSGSIVIENSIPTAHTSAILNSSSGTNLTSENLTLSLSGATDLDSHAIHNITDWRINSSSWNILNIPFDIEESTITDFSTNQLSGVINGNPSYTSSGQIGGAYDFDGTGDYINFTDGGLFEEINGNFTLETWIKMDSFPISGSTYAFSTCNIFNIAGFCLQITDSEKYWMTMTNNSVVVKFIEYTALESSWQHVVATYDTSSENLSLYVNGTLVNSSWIGQSSASSSNGYAIIGADYLGNAHFNGQISDLKVYNNSLSAEQIAYNYERGLSGLHIDKIMSQETEVGQNWTVNVTTTDLYDIGNSKLSNPLLIVEESSNTAPTISLTSPADGNVTTNRTPTFTYAGSDTEGDSLVYNINITEAAGCGSSDDRTQTSYIGTYTPSTDLLFLSDNGCYYEWTVRACENETADLFCSDWATPRSINISALVSINLTNDFIDFGSMDLGVERNTTNVSIDAFLINNNGNSKVNVSVNASSIFDSVIGTSSYFRIKSGDYAGNASSAVTNWFNIPITGYSVLVDTLNYSDGSDSISADILLEVPNNEPGGEKSSIVNFLATLAEE